MPTFEDLSFYCNNEVTVLQAVYGQDFSKEPGGNWGVHIYNIQGESMFGSGIRGF
jgi:hypothetical protein